MQQEQVEQVCQLPPLQHGVFFEALRKHGSEKMIYQAWLELRGEVEPSRLRAAWHTVARRHPSLRTSFHYDRLDTPVQVTRRSAEPPWRELDWRDRSLPENRARLDELLAEDRTHPFDLTRAPLFRLVLIRADAERSWLVWTLHPLLVDGWSFYLVLADVLRCYRDPATGGASGSPLPRPYWEYVAWLKQRDTAGAEEFWRSRLAGLPVPVPLGDDIKASGDTDTAPSDASHRKVMITVPDDLADALDAVTRRCRVTLGTVIHAAWGVTLARYTGQDDVVFGGIISGRDPSFHGVEGVVGVFMNNQPVRIRPRQDQPVSEWLAEFQKELADARQYAHIPLSTVQRCAGLPPGTPLFESMVDFCNYPVQEQWTDGGDIEVADLHLLQSPPYPLGLIGAGGAEGWRLFVSYDPARFLPATGSALAELFTSVLTAMAERPDQRVADLPGWTSAPPSASRSEPAERAPSTAGGEPVTTNGPTDLLLDLVTAIWAQALGLTDHRRITETSSFFELGGHSLVAIRLVSRLRSVFDVDFTVGHFFADPTVGGTVRALGSLLGDNGANGDNGSVGMSAPIPRAPRDTPVRASFAQERLWFVDRLDEHAPANNLLVSSRFRTDLPAGPVRGMVARLLERHEVLRTCLRERDGVVVQEILPRVDPPLTYVDLSGEPAGAAESRARLLLAEDARRRFDLAAEPPIRVTLIRLGPDDTILGLCLHHVAYDGWSTDLLVRDLEALYEAETTGRPAALPPLPVQYADFSAWQRERLSGPRSDTVADYWRTELSGLPPRLRLGPARQVRTRRHGRAGVVGTVLPPTVDDRIRAMTVAEGVTPFMVLLAAYGVLLARHSGREDIAVGTPVADRDHPDLESLIGLFINTHVLRLRLGGQPTFRDLLARVRKVCLDALAHRDLPFATVVRMVAPDRMADQMPLVQVSFTMRNGAFRALRLGGAVASYFPVRHNVPRSELSADIYESSDGLHCEFHYAEDVYQRAFVERLVHEYADLVGDLLADPDRPVMIAPEPHDTGDGDGENDENDENDADETALRKHSEALLRSLSRR